jgi:TRAP-type C4-dicarboxylate transport system permease small subunit
MRLEKLGYQLETKMSLVTKRGQIIAFVVIALLILLTTIDVVDRRFLGGRFIVGVYELSGLMVSVACFAAIGNAEFLRQHLAIDLITGRLTGRPKAIIAAAMWFLYLVTICFLAWGLVKVGMDAIHTGTITQTLGILIYPFLFFGAFGCFLLAVMILAHFLLYMAKAAEK